MFWPFVAFWLLVYWIGMGFTWMWWLLVMGMVGIAWVMLWRNGQRAGYKRMLVGLTVVLTSLITLYRGYTWDRPVPPEGIDPAALEYSIGDDLIGFSQVELGMDADQFVVFPPDMGNDDITIEIGFSEISAAGELYAVESGIAEIVCNDDCDMTPIPVNAQTSDPDWTGGDLVGEDMEFVSPLVEFSDIRYDRLTVHAWYTVTATATIAYPDESGQTQQVERERTLSIYIGNRTDREARRALNQWLVLDEAMNEFPTDIGIMVIAVMFGGLGIWGYLDNNTFPRKAIGPTHLIKSIETTAFDPESVLTMNPPPVGIRVVRVQAGSTWEVAGVTPGDVLMRVAGRSIDSRSDLDKALFAVREERVVPISVWREGSVYDLALDIAPVKGKRSSFQ
jgi:hypothetical protein